MASPPLEDLDLVARLEAAAAIEAVQQDEIAARVLLDVQPAGRGVDSFAGLHADDVDPEWLELRRLGRGERAETAQALLEGRHVGTVQAAARGEHEPVDLPARPS